MSNTEKPDMTNVFELDHDGLAADPRFTEMAGELSKLSPIDSKHSFNRYCREAIRSWGERFREGVGKTSSEFTKLLEHVERGGENVIRTGWGGVVITLHEHPQVEKFLVINQGGYLALEMHEQKDEHVEVKEGAGLILWRSSPGQPLTVETLGPGAEFHFEPGTEHCLIGTENLLVFERSVDPKGMDQDLVFIYEPEGDAESEANVQRSLRAVGSSEPEATLNPQRPMQKEP
jgi:hypothetical protein